MNKIQHLTPEICNHIAAGEVVERPGNVVKELIENSIDAQANRIELQVSSPVQNQIRIKDNGQGIAKEDLELALQRHATSKIQKLEDLWDIHTLGFRGEGLAASAAVSELSIQSRTADSELGFSIQSKFGNIQKIQNCVINPGTIVEIQNLFANLPARQKFLKSDSTEYQHCQQHFLDLALAHPEINFIMKKEDKLVYDFPIQNFADRLGELVGKDIFQELIPFHYQEDILQIEGYISRPGYSFSHRKNQKIILNGRVIHDYLISSAIHKAYETHLPSHAQAGYFLKIQISADLVDWNVHPTKLEVRWRPEIDIFHKIQTIIQSAFPKPQSNWTPLSQSPSSFTNYSHPISPLSDQSLPLDLQVQDEAFSFNPAPYRLIGQFAEKFILVELDSQLIIIDQHALHERQRYETLVHNWENQTKDSQILLIPQLLKVSHWENALLEKTQIALQKLGFDLQQFGPQNWQILSVPLKLAESELASIILELAQSLDEQDLNSPFNTKTLKSLASIACRGSVMFGEKLNSTEIQSILEQWWKNSEGLTCPHGRPISYTISTQELAKKFER
ncbi:MAG TPA: DNA mismatch repair endonuclease MutL [Candidatus Gracilibacteria bacterium]|nr:DNA mismatch repair endonuclease MutL [Candidatus Gracilibacteria bacterium]